MSVDESTQVEVMMSVMKKEPRGTDTAAASVC